MDRIWRWVWDRYGSRYSWAVWGFAVLAVLGPYLITSFQVIAFEGSIRYVEAVAVTFVAALVICYLLKRHSGQKMFCTALALILGGALGNVIDRLAYGHVIDFLDFHVGGWHWPAFNLADSAITIGAVLLVIDELRRVRGAR